MCPYVYIIITMYFITFVNYIRISILSFQGPIHIFIMTITKSVLDFSFETERFKLNPYLKGFVIPILKFTP